MINTAACTNPTATWNPIDLIGDFLYETLANLEEELRDRLSESMRHKISDSTGSRDLLVIGYGATDETVMEIFALNGNLPQGPGTQKK